MPPGKKGGRKRANGADSCTMPFHFVFSGALVSGGFTFPVQASVFTRVALEADVWAHFRVSKLSFRMLPTSPSTVPMAAGYVGGIEDTAPSTFAQIVELIPSCIKGTGQTVPTNWVKVPRTDLAGPFPWYKTVPGTADATEESPGQISIAGTGTETYALELKGTFVFKTSVAAANTPLALKYRKLLRDERIRAYLVKEKGVILRAMTIDTSEKPS